MPRINDAGLSIIRRFEGLRLIAYDDGTGVLTIGYGHTRNVYRGEQITLAQAETYLAADIGWAEAAVQNATEVDLTPNQFSALVSFTFNVGAEAERTSTLLRMVNASNFVGAAAQFVRWDDPGTPEEAGLLRRRIAERDLFVTP